LVRVTHSVESSRCALNLPREPFYDCLLLTYFAHGHKRS
jgi:hypothetical protein